MPNPTMWARAANALDLGRAMKMARMGLKHKQLGGVLGAYFGGAQVPSIAAGRGAAYDKALMSYFKHGASRSTGAAAMRIGAAGAAGLAALNIGGGNDAFAGATAAGAFYGAYRGLGGISALSSSPGRTVARGAIGLMAGSIAWQGLRAPRMADYQ